PPASSRSQSSRARAAPTCSSSSAQGSMRSSSRAATSSRSSVTRSPRSEHHVAPLRRRRVTAKVVTRLWRPGWIALAAILVLAAALRLTGIRYGLPLPVLNPDEANIVPRGWRMGHGHPDPGWYDYPSLLMALLAPVQALFAAPSYLAARLVAVGIGVGGVGA